MFVIAGIQLWHTVIVVVINVLVVVDNFLTSHDKLLMFFFLSVVSGAEEDAEVGSHHSSLQALHSLDPGGGGAILQSLGGQWEEK